MKRTTIGLAFALALLSSAATAQERAGDAVLGAVSGAVVLGPIGAVAGAFVGYAAGPSIANSWGLRRSSHHRYARRPASEPAANAGNNAPAPRSHADVAAVASAPPAPSPQAAPSPPPAPKAGTAMPPVQPLE